MACLFATACGALAAPAPTPAPPPAAPAAVDVEFRMVPYDRPDVTVETLERQAPVARAVTTARGTEFQRVGLDVVCWGRNVLLDGLPLFERYHEGRYIDRLPRAKQPLKPGKHVIWPGDHAFTVAADGGITTDSPELIVEKALVRIKSYPVTVRARRIDPGAAGGLAQRGQAGGTPATAPATSAPSAPTLDPTAEIAPLPDMTIRDAAEDSPADPKKAPKPHDLLPLYEHFAPLTVWLPASGKEGKGYVLHPMGLAFHLGAAGITPIAADGNRPIPGVRIAGWAIDVPLLSLPVTGQAGCGAVIQGVEKLTWTARDAGSVKDLDWYPRRLPYELRVSAAGPAIVVAGGLLDLPVKSAAVDMPDRASGALRAVLVELPARHYRPGETVRLRVRGVAPKSPTTTAPATAPAAPATDESDRSYGSHKSYMSYSENLLAGAAPFGRVQALEGGAWTELVVAPEPAGAAGAPTSREAASPGGPQAGGASAASGFAETREGDTGANGGATFVVPSLPPDVYRLQLGLRPKDASAPPITTEVLVTIAGPRPAAAGLFTQRGRTAFYRGEAFWIGLGAIDAGAPDGRGNARGAIFPAGTAVQMDLLDAAGRRITILRESTTQPIRGRATFVARLSSAASLALAPGEYRVEAKLGELAARPRRITIVETEPRTHFTNLLSGKYNTLGEEYARVIASGRGAEELAHTIVDMGYNAFMGMSYDLDRVVHAGAAIERLVRQRPELGPWESYTQPSGRDRFLDACVRNNLPFWENMLTYNDTSLPREEKILAACGRFTGLETQSMEYSPAFRGVCLYDEVYSRSLNDGVPIVAAFERAHEMNYRRDHPGMTSTKAAKALERFVARPAGQRPYDELAAFRTWPAQEDRAWQVFSSGLAGAARQAMPGSFNFTFNRYWGHNGGNLGQHGREEDVFAPLDAAACVMYKDGGSGDRPVFAAMQADVMRVRDGLPVWTQLHNFSGEGLFGAHLLREAFFALSQKVEGFSYFTIQHDPKSPQFADNRNTIRAVAGTLCTRYGDFWLSLDRGYKKVAIYYSRQADYLTLRKPNNLRCQCEGLWVACVRAGFPADFLRDDDIRAGRGMGYDVIFAPGFAYEEECPADLLDALKRLVGAGKVLAVERSSKLPVEGAVRLESELDEYDDKMGGAFPKFIDFESEMVWDQTEQTTKLVREFLTKRVAPAAVHDALVGPDWLRRGEGQYMVMPNFAPTGFTGLYKTLYQAPDCPTLRFPKRPPVCYDVLEMRRADVKTDGDWMTLQADMRHCPGKVYAFLPAAVEAVGLKAPAAVRAGDVLRYEASVLDAAGKPIDASFPLEVRLADPAGATVLEVYRAAAPTFVGAYAVPANAAGGKWTLRVRELVSGSAAEAAVGVEVAAPAAAGAGAGTGPGAGSITATLDTRKVLVYDAPRIRAVLSTKLGSPAPAATAPASAPATTPSTAIAPGPPAFLIPLGEAQAWARPAALRLRDELARRGRPARIVPVEQVMRLPGPWDDKAPVIDGSRLWRGEAVSPPILADAPLILLGRRGENTFLDALIARDALAAPLTDAFPGPGRAMLAWTRRAFSNEHDTVSLLACDDQGLAAGVAELLAIVDGTSGTGSGRNNEEPTHPTVATAPSSSREAASGADGQPASVKVLPREVSPFPDAIFGEDMVRCVDVDATTGRVLVGTFGYGDNLFCLGPDGKLMWKLFLPEHNVYLARWYDGGKRVLAATGRGYSVFLLDGRDGKVLRKFASTEWARTHWNEGSVETEVQIEINAPARQILIGGLTGLMAVDFDGKRQWFYDRSAAMAAIPKEADPGAAAAAFGNTVSAGNFALSPDGSKVVYGEYEICGSTIVMLQITNIWAFRPKIMDARTGEVLAGWTGDSGNQTRPGGWWVSWPAESAAPLVHTGELAAPLAADGKLGPYVAIAGTRFADGGRLVCTPTSVERRDPAGRTAWHADGMPVCTPTLDRTNAAGNRLYRSDQDGGVHCVDLAGGKTVWSARLPFAAVLTPAGADGVIAGGLDGTVASLAEGGKPRWSVRLRELHEMPKTDYAAYVDAAARRDVDSSGEMFAAGQDAKGEYDAILRMGLEQLEDGAFEGRGEKDAAAGAGAWIAQGGGAAAFSDQAHEGKRALRLGAGQLVTQKITRRVVPSGTYLLEFCYRVGSADARLVAGARMMGETNTTAAGAGAGAQTQPTTKPTTRDAGEASASEADDTLTVSTFRGRPGEWAFGRLAIKSMSATRRMEIGFEAAGGEVLVDEASLRAVRFPSANLLACEELHAVTPTFVRDLRIRYKRIPAALDSKLLGLNRVAVYKQGGTDAATIYTDEQAFLHNGRLDDVGNVWTYVPEAMGFSVVLSQPAWVSHLVLYLNNATPDNVYRTISILANDMETKMPRCVAMVRNNRRRFIVVHFDAPVRTDSLKVLPGHQARAHRDCLTEVEVYGPLGGPDQGQAARRFPDDPNGWPMFMGCPSHAPTVRPVDLAGTFRPAGRVHLESPAFFVGPTVTAGLCTFGDADGSIRSMTIPTPPPPEPPADAGAGAAGAAAGAKPKPKPKPSGSPDPKSRPQPGPSWVLGTVTPITTPARYAGRLFAGCADEKLHAVADNGAHLWAFQTEGRVYSSPLPDGDDVYFGCDDGKLYKVDADSGILLWELPTGGPIRGAPAMAEGRVFAPSWDGLLYAVTAETGREAWRAPIARFTRGSPAVAGGRVYLGDEDGAGRCFEAASGKPLWQTPVGGRIVACPVVTEGGVVLASEQGHLAMLALADGKAVWSRKLEAAVRGQPVATRSQLLVPTAAGLEVLRLADGRADERVKLPDQPAGVTAAVPYGGRICILTATAKAHEVNGRSYVRFDGAATLWVAEDKAAGTAAGAGMGGGK